MNPGHSARRLRAALAADIALSATATGLCLALVWFGVDSPLIPAWFRWGVLVFVAAGAGLAWHYKLGYLRLRLHRIRQRQAADHQPNNQ